MTVAAGQTASYSITATPIGNFRGLFTFTCTAPAAVSWSVGTQSVDATTGAETVTVAAMVSPAASSSALMAMILPGVVLAGLGLRRRRRAFSFLVVLGVGTLALAVAGMAGCGSNGGSRMNTLPVTQSFTITATAGGVSHTTVLTLNVQ
jgi:hypothetical protein